MKLYVNKIYMKEIHCFNIEQIANSGQVFRVTKEEEGYRFLSKDKSIYVKQIDDKIYFSCSLEEFRNYWNSYFNLENFIYEEISKEIKKDDEFLQNCYSYGKGIRILKQDLFETMISFILSQRKSIPAIQSCIEKFCEKFGKEKLDTCGRVYYSFPNYEELKDITLEDLQGLSFGYRDKYVYQFIQDLTSKKIVLTELEQFSREKQEEILLNIYGVGMKVMSCISLFSLQNFNAFPIDVWIQRILEEKYNGTFPYKENQGLLQQYIFFYALNHKKEFKK